MPNHGARTDNIALGNEGLSGAFTRRPNSAVLALDPLMRVSGFNAEAEWLTGIAAAHVLNQPLEALPEFLQQIVWDSLRTGLAAHGPTSRSPCSRKAC